MTVDSNHVYKSRRNSRARRNSVVERIALKIPQNLSDLSITQGEEEEKDIIPIKRTKSFDNIIATTPHKYDLDKFDSIIYPFTKKEQHEISNTFIDSLSFKILNTDEEEIELRNNANLKYQIFLQSCQFRENQYRDLIGKTSSIIEDLTQLTLKFDEVSKDTANFQNEADKLINEFNSYTNLNEELKNNLYYYEQFESITRKLNNPNPNIVRKESFRKLLTTLDECLKFLEEHPEHNDHEIYLRRFKHCKTRALTLIRNYIINNLKSIRDEIHSKLDNTKVNSITNEALIYTRFTKDLEYLITVTSELCSRASESPEFEGLLDDCYNFYFGIRNRFLQPLINEHFKTVNKSSNSSTIQYTQNNISFFKKIYKDEYGIFFQIFTLDNKKSLTNWFQSLSEPLYDNLRHKILREHSITSLSELATLLDKYYEYDEEFDQDFENDATNAFNNNYNYNGPRIHDFEHDVDLGIILQPILQDVQTRLVFRAQSYIDENIVKYKPTIKDFQISRRRSTVTNKVNTINNDNHDNDNVAEGDDDDDEFNSSIILSTSNKTGMKDWYPPLSRGVSLLSKIYQLISSSVFDDLAHNIVHDCIISVRSGYEIAQSSLGSTNSDLFFMKNLLMLQQQIQNFDIEYISSEVVLDFSGIGDIINKIIKRENLISIDNKYQSNGGYLGLLQDSVPKVIKNMIDARIELQVELNTIVQKFTNDSIEIIIEPLKLNFNNIEQEVEDLKSNISQYLPQLQIEIKNFINDGLIINSLIDGIQELILQNYEIYYNNVIKNDESNVQYLLEIDTLNSFIDSIISKILLIDDEDHDADNGLNNLEEEINQIDLNNDIESFVSN
ncbi:hypothetical protein WICMUC_005529 [Wickerhamomyces mucosus]|uniref:Conserved oligomeric Golgi complex subunit 3 n=1 Tax=Wickerhamomyces mucosus TaxID=1378264 RepID=A0A9P8P7G4_9ASCO|nr:hypothetical protein WICMUC_005529 [Wickerhamomyces mucosus]